MAKSKDPITQADLVTFLADDSDFSFEMQVLSQLRNLGFECEHSGTYRDPITEKIRQFDIRAWKNGQEAILALAVECKNLRENRPLLVSAVPRTESEAFHDIARYQIYKSGMHVPGVQTVRPIRTLYKLGEMVGKKTGQVGKDGSGNYSSDDQATFEKLNQALNSCRDIVQRFATRSSEPFVRAIVPVLVVPNGPLWQVDYKADGTLATPPRRVQRSTLFVNHAWQFEHPMSGRTSLRLSHIELVTLTSLASAVDHWLSDKGFFPKEM